MNDLISRQAAIDAAVEAADEWDGGYSRSREEIITLKLLMLPSAQPDITDVQAIEHLQATGWMQNHDHEMYMMGIRDGLADDSDSYDSLIQPEQKVGKWIEHKWAEEAKGFLISNYECSHCHSWERKKELLLPELWSEDEGGVIVKKITTTLREYFNNKEICEPKRPVENIIFVGSNNEVLSNNFKLFNHDCYFRNCEFQLYSAYGYDIGFVNCIFENCVFYRGSIFTTFRSCVFINNSFPDGFRCAFNPATKFFSCHYDNSILELLHKEMACPVSGEFVGWKKGYLCRRISEGSDLASLVSREAIVKLLVPEDSKRSSSISNKCRCEKAKVLEIQSIDGEKINISEEYIVASIYEFESIHPRIIVPMDDLHTRYIPGEMVYADKFNPDPLVECGGGIHFFMTREEALEYIFC